MPHDSTGSAIQATESSGPSQVTPAKGNRLTVEEVAALKKREEERNEQDRKQQMRTEYEKMRKTDASGLTAFPPLDPDGVPSTEIGGGGSSLISPVTSLLQDVGDAGDALSNTFGFSGHGPVPSASASEGSTTTQASVAWKEK